MLRSTIRAPDQHERGALVPCATFEVRQVWKHSEGGLTDGRGIDDETSFACDHQQGRRKEGSFKKNII